MISSAIVQYKVTDEELGFSTVTNSQAEAAKIDNNLSTTKKIIAVLDEYNTLKNNSKSSDSYECTTTQNYIINENGTLDGIYERWSTTHVDNWDGRPSLTDHGTNKIIGKDFEDKVINPLIAKLNRGLKALDTISPSVELFFDLPKSVFDFCKSEKMILQTKIEILNKAKGFCFKLNT
jgi:hypothetical protein